MIVEGVCKKFEHEAGQLVGDESDDRWTAVYVQSGGWQLVHPYWLCKGRFLFDLSLYVPVYNSQLCRNGSSWVESVLSKDKGVLLKDTT